MQDSSGKGRTIASDTVQSRSVARVVRIEVEDPQVETGSPSAIDVWPRLLEEAKAEGYNTVSIVARGSIELELGALLRAAANSELAISLNVAPETVTLLAPQDAALVQHWVLRLNGPGERAACSARMTVLLQALRALAARRAQICLGFHLDQSNLDDLPWAAWLAAEQGVDCLTVETARVHSSTAPRSVHSQLDVSQRVWSMLVLARARQRYPSTRYEIDLSDVNLVRLEPQRLLAVPAALEPKTPLAEWVSPLVIDARGKATPLLGTLSPKLALGNVHDASLRSLIQAWKVTTAPAFQHFCRQVHADVCENTVLPFFNWAEHLQLQSRRMDAIVPRLPTPAPERGANAALPTSAARLPPSPALSGKDVGVMRTLASAQASWSPLRPNTTHLPKLPWGGLHDDRIVQPPPARRTG
jgi:hypothetical protein